MKDFEKCFRCGHKPCTHIISLIDDRGDGIAELSGENRELRKLVSEAIPYIEAARDECVGLADLEEHARTVEWLERAVRVKK
jgi:hypothetical protein